MVIRVGPNQTFQQASFVQPSDFVRVDPGTFEMGENPPRWSLSDADGGVRDVRKRTIVLSREFWICNHEVTQGEYKELMVWLGKSKSFDRNPSVNQDWFPANRKDNFPVENVTWDQAVEYCIARTQKEFQEGKLPSGWGYRLPTEAEWEYAATCGTWVHPNLVDAYDPEVALNVKAWTAANAGGDTREVKTRKANRWGLYDMLGNVAEWVADWYAPYPTWETWGVALGNWTNDSEFGPSETDPKGPERSHLAPRVYTGRNWGETLKWSDNTDPNAAKPLRVFRGFSFRDKQTSGFTEPYTVTFTGRSKESPQARDRARGFRVVVSKVPAPGRYRPLYPVMKEFKIFK